MKKIHLTIEASGAQVFAYEIDESIIKFLKKNAEDGYPIPSLEIVYGGEITLIPYGLDTNNECTFTVSIDSQVLIKFFHD